MNDQIMDGPRYHPLFLRPIFIFLLAFRLHLRIHECVHLFDDECVHHAYNLCDLHVEQMGEDRLLFYYVDACDLYDVHGGGRDEREICGRNGIPFCAHAYLMRKRKESKTVTLVIQVSLNTPVVSN